MRLAGWLAAWLALGLVVACFYGGDVWQGPDGSVVHLEDDNMITLRVAANMAAEGVPYFNAGEAVAANTSLFWPLILAPVTQLLGAEALPIWLFHASALISVAAALFAAGLVRGWAAAAVLVLAILINPGFIKYGGSGWEHVPQMLAVTLGFSLILMNRDRRFAADALGFGAICLAFALRPDSAVLAVGAWLILCAAHLRARPFPTLLVSLAGLVVPGLYLFLMLRYYGDVVPNTVYLKSTGLGEVERGLVSLGTPHLSGWVPFVLLAVTAFVWRRGSSAPARDQVVALILLAQVAMSVFSGGDVFAAGRFYLAILPIAFALAVRAGGRSLPQGGALTAVALLALGVWSAQPTWQGPLWQRDNGRDANRMASHVELSVAISERLEPQDGSVGLHRLGQAYHLRDFHVVDFLGKAEPHIARTPPQLGPKGHNKWDYDHVLARYDIAVAPFPMSEADLLAHADLPPHNWMYLWIFGRSFLESGSYTLLTPQELGLSAPHWGLFVRNDLVSRFR